MVAQCASTFAPLTCGQGFELPTCKKWIKEKKSFLIIKIVSIEAKTDRLQLTLKRFQFDDFLFVVVL